MENNEKYADRDEILISTFETDLYNCFTLTQLNEAISPLRQKWGDLLKEVFIYGSDYIGGYFSIGAYRYEIDEEYEPRIKEELEWKEKEEEKQYSYYLKLKEKYEK